MDKAQGIERVALIAHDEAPGIAEPSEEQLVERPGRRLLRRSVVGGSREDQGRIKGGSGEDQGSRGWPFEAVVPPSTGNTTPVM
jgi:hypothetical protein